MIWIHYGNACTKTLRRSRELQACISFYSVYNHVPPSLCLPGSQLFGSLMEPNCWQQTYFQFLPHTWIAPAAQGSFKVCKQPIRFASSRTKITSTSEELDVVPWPLPVVLFWLESEPESISRGRKAVNTRLMWRETLQSDWRASRTESKGQCLMNSSCAHRSTNVIEACLSSASRIRVELNGLWFRVSSLLFHSCFFFAHCTPGPDSFCV